jgi:carboxymethylenebutenolidase
MAETIRVASRFDGFEVPAYHVPPGNARRGGVIVLQEIFGVNGHIRTVADAFAQDGYEVLAPSMFERHSPGFEGGHDARGVARGMAAMQKTPWDQVQGDLQAMIDHLAGPVFVVGYCWGGAAAWLAACRCEGVAAASCYYGRQILALKDETPRCPVILHYGDSDTSIPLDDVETVREAHPEIPLHTYAAGHAFNNDARPEHYVEDAARLARLRTLQLFHQSASGKGGESGA